MEVTDDGVIRVGPRDRGRDAPEAVVVLDVADLDEYFQDLADAYGDGRLELSPDRFVMLVLEDVTTLHDGGDSDLTTEVRLRRGAQGPLGLVDVRRRGASPPLPDDGSVAWVADRPDP